MADKLKALKKENKELKKLLAKAKELLLTYHDILKQPEHVRETAAAPKKQPAARKKSSKRVAGTKRKKAKTQSADA